MTDSSGAVVSNAQVSDHRSWDQSLRETKTNWQGEYRVFGLSSGEYKVTVTAPGMSTAQLTGIRLTAAAW